MKTMFIAFAIIVVLMAVIMLGGAGFYKFVQWMGWPLEVILIAALAFTLLAGISGVAMALAMNDQRAVFRKEIVP